MPLYKVFVERDARIVEVTEGFIEASSSPSIIMFLKSVLNIESIAVGVVGM